MLEIKTKQKPSYFNRFDTLFSLRQFEITKESIRLAN